jgi:2-keto-4-pentenoate hydratase
MRFRGARRPAACAGASQPIRSILTWGPTVADSDSDELAGTIGRALEAARRSRQPVPPLTQSYDGLSSELAYRVQQFGIGLREQEGAGRVGHKVGLTSEAMQHQLGVDQPDYGVLLDTMVVPSGATIRLDNLIAPRIEAEIAVRIGRPLAGPHTSLEQVTGAVSAVVPALEVIDSRILDWRISLIDTIADNASSALAVVGQPVEPPDLRLASQSVTLFEDDEVVGHGAGDALLGDPWNSLLWLVRTLDTFGEGLRAGDIVLLGAVHASVPLRSGRRYHAAYDTWGEVDCLVR